jgi:hypothetical protein
VLSNIPDVRTAVNWRAGSSLAALDAGLPGGVAATWPHGTGVLAMPRPRALQGALVPCVSQAPGQMSAFGERDTRKKYQHATRVAVIGGSASGSHPAWDPV